MFQLKGEAFATEGSAQTQRGAEAPSRGEGRALPGEAGRGFSTGWLVNPMGGSALAVYRSAMIFAATSCGSAMPDLSSPG